MEQEQANSAGGQNSAQNPPPTPSSSKASPREDEHVETNNTKGNLHPEAEEEGEEEEKEEEEEQGPSVTEKHSSPITLPLLPLLNSSNKSRPTTDDTTTDDDLANPSPYTNLSRHPITNEMVFGPIPDREYHERFMRKAIEMAQLALDSDETPVGCVFVRDGEVIGRGINGTNASLNGTRHAEFVALCEIMSRHHPSILHTTDLYVTVEPCIMCASALRQFGIRSVYFGCLNDRFGGTGGVMTVHMDDSVDPAYPVYGGLFREEAIMLLRRFYVQENDKAPEPKPKKNRELKTEILPVGVPSGGNTPANLIPPAAATPVVTPVVGTPTTETPAAATPVVTPVEGTPAAETPAG